MYELSYEGGLVLCRPGLSPGGKVRGKSPVYGVSYGPLLTILLLEDREKEGTLRSYLEGFLGEVVH